MRKFLVLLGTVPLLTIALPAQALPPGVTCKSGQAIIHGTAGIDDRGPFNGPVCFVGYGGNDIIRGSMYADNLWGMDGNDELLGLQAADLLKGGTGGTDQIWDGPNPTGNGDYIDGGGGTHDEHYHCSTNAQYDTRTATTEYWTSPVPGYC